MNCRFFQGIHGQRKLSDWSYWNYCSNPAGHVSVNCEIMMFLSFSFNFKKIFLIQPEPPSGPPEKWRKKKKIDA